MSLQLTITLDPQTGALHLGGNVPLENMIVWHGMLGEARRMVERAADQRDAAGINGDTPRIVLANGLLRQ
jgi:hypothetical protein